MVARGVVLLLVLIGSAPAFAEPAAVDASTLRGKVMAGYQGWFRCPGDAANMGWVHWSRDGRRISPETLSFEMWPDMSEYTAAEKFAAPGFTYPNGEPAHLFSSDNAATVLRHFQWMRDYGIDGAWLQQFVLELPGGPVAKRYPTRKRVMEHVIAAATQTGRTWAMCYDVSGTPGDKIYDVLTQNWKSLVDEKPIGDTRYLREGGKPVVKIWGFYGDGKTNAMTAETANRLIDFFKADGPYAAYVVGGGAWFWRKNTDPAWQAVYRRLDAYCPWNVGNLSKDRDGTKHAATAYWAEDKKEFERGGGMWIPVVYPGFSWDNLKRQAPGTTGVPRRGGQFLWEQFRAAATVGARHVYVAMFDEVDEGTAVFKVTSTPPTQGQFMGYENLPSDWYLRLIGEAGRRWRAKEEIPAEIPIKP